MVSLLSLFLRPKVTLKEPQHRIPCFAVSVSVFRLDAGLGSQLILNKGVDQVIFLVGVLPKAIGVKFTVTDAERRFF